jgi:hypothetical protein
MKPKNLLKRVLQFAREELERRARSPGDEPPAYDSTPPHVRYAADEGYTSAHQPVDSSLTRGTASLDASELHGLEVLRSHTGGPLTLRWTVDEQAVARAQALLQGHPVLCLRVVSFSKTRDDVLREVQDRPGIERSGRIEIQEPSQRAVVALGLRSGDRFVSLSHHVL